MTASNDEVPESPGADNRFHLIAVAFQRLHQLQAGARPNLPRGRHTSTRLAVMEVIAGTVSWELGAAPEVVPRTVREA